MNLILILLQAAPRQQTGAANYSGILMVLIIGLIIYYFVKVRSKSKSMTPIVTEQAINSDLKWHQKPISVILFLIFFFPVGIYLMWKNSIWTKNARIIISIVFVLLVVANLNKNSTTKNDSFNSTDNCSGHESDIKQSVINKAKNMGMEVVSIQVDYIGNCEYRCYQHIIDLGSAYSSPQEINQTVILEWDGNAHKFIRNE